MTRPQLEHILRAATGITGADSFVIIGSQAVLGQYPDAPAELRESIEADIYSLRSSHDAALIEGSIGERSPFHETFGYYAHGVGEETATLPDRWKERLIKVSNANTGGATGLCLEVHDLAVSKLVAGREKDVAFVRSMLRFGLVKLELLRDRLAQTKLSGSAVEACERRLRDARLV